MYPQNSNGVGMGGRNTCMCGLDWVSSLVRLGNETFTIEHTALKVASSNMVKHEKACYDNQHTFIPFAFDMFTS